MNALKVRDPTFLTDDTGNFVVMNYSQKLKEKEQRELVKSIVDQFKTSTIPVENEDKKRIAELEKLVAEYQRRMPYLDEVIDQSKIKLKEKATLIKPFFDKFIIESAGGSIENNILNPIVSMYVMESNGREIRPRTVPQLLKILYGLSYKQSGGKTFYPGIEFNPQTFGEIKHLFEMFK